CARLCAIHAIVFGGFSPDSLASRIQGCGSKVVITADEGLRGGAQPEKRRAVPRDHAAAAENCESLYQVISRRHCAIYFIEHCTLIARWMSDD
ncbi:hypothetical protein OMR07_25500, partial [Methylobacterium organophilum]|nr:hypothetical protein [Methylobacterium organophilum]